MIVLFIGPPGCGKGTQSVLFHKRGNFFIFSVGNLLRNLYLKFSPDPINLAINKGNLIQPEIIFNNILDDSIFFKKIIVDGFPRNLNQALFFEKFLNERNLRIDYIFEFQARKEKLIERIKSRKLCSKCLKNVISKICECGCKQFVFRQDDSKDIFENRFCTYIENRESIYNYYKNKTQYILINSELQINVVFKNLLRYINILS